MKDYVTYWLEISTDVEGMIFEGHVDGREVDDRLEVINMPYAMKQAMFQHNAQELHMKWEPCWQVVEHRHERLLETDD